MSKLKSLTFDEYKVAAKATLNEAIDEEPDAVITLERNSMAENEDERHLTKIAVAKNRYNGETGPACKLQYNGYTGRMVEVEEEVL